MKGQNFLKTTSILMIVGGIIAGMKGLKVCKVHEIAKKCVTWGILIVVVSIISMAIGLIGGGKFSISNLTLNLLVPGLYIYRAMQMKTSD